MTYSRFACGAALAGAILACRPDDEGARESVAPPDIEAVLVHESDRVRVFTQPGMPYCQGDGARLDAHVERLAAKLEVEPPQIPIYVVADDQGRSIADWCFGGYETLAGCFQPWVIMSKIWAVPHELNHVVLEVLNSNHDVRGASLFWFEAYASTWETEATTPRMSGLWEQESWAAYQTADHLLRWLEDTRGSTAVRDFYATLDRDWQSADVEAAFADMFGMSYEHALERFEAEAPPIYPGYGWCADVEVIDVPLGKTRVDLRVDCDAADTYAFADSPIEGMYVRRILRLAKPAELQIESSSEIGMLRRHPCLEKPVVSPEDPRLADGAWSSTVDAGGPSMVTVMTIPEVPAGENLIELLVPRGRPIDLELSILATPSSKPQD